MSTAYLRSFCSDSFINEKNFLVDVNNLLQSILMKKTEVIAFVSCYTRLSIEPSAIFETTRYEKFDYICTKFYGQQYCLSSSCQRKQSKINLQSLASLYTWVYFVPIGDRFSSDLHCTANLPVIYIASRFQLSIKIVEYPKMKLLSWKYWTIKATLVRKRSLLQSGFSLLNYQISYQRKRNYGLKYIFQRFWHEFIMFLEKLSIFTKTFLKVMLSEKEILIVLWDSILWC